MCRGSSSDIEPERSNRPLPRTGGVTSHLGLAAAVKISNIWVFGDGRGHRFIIDAGHRLERMALRRDLWRANLRRPGDVTAILLTHRHSDHAGNAAWLRERFDCPVICHEDDAPFLLGEREAPRLATKDTPLWARSLCMLEDRYPARVEVDDVFDDGSWKWGFEVYHSPGHTEGSVMMYHAPTRTLFSGDVVLAGLATMRPIERVTLADPNFSEDIDQCRRVVNGHLRRMPPTKTLASGHGPPVTDDANAKLRRLIR